MERRLFKLKKLVDFIKRELGRNCYAIVLGGSFLEKKDAWDIDILVLTWSRNLKEKKLKEKIIKKFQKFFKQELDIGFKWFISFYRSKNDPYSAIAYKEYLKKGKILYLGNLAKIFHKILK